MIRQKAHYDQLYTACIISCPIEDVECIGECARTHHDNMLKCPCQEGCPSGCPCPDYECPSSDTTTVSTTTTTETATSPKPAYSDVLILNQYNSDNPAVITNASGKDDRSINFQFGENTEVKYSCGVTFRNEHFIFGGNTLKTQISQVVGCKLKNIGQLTFQHQLGGCANIQDQSIYLCFGESPYKKCRVLKSPTGQVDGVTESAYDHQYTRIGASRGE